MATRSVWTSVLIPNPEEPSSPRLILRRVPAPVLCSSSSRCSTVRSPPLTPHISSSSSPSSSRSSLSPPPTPGRGLFSSSSSPLFYHPPKSSSKPYLHCKKCP